MLGERLSDVSVAEKRGLQEAKEGCATYIIRMGATAPLSKRDVVCGGEKGSGVIRDGSGRDGDCDTDGRGSPGERTRSGTPFYTRRAGRGARDPGLAARYIEGEAEAELGLLEDPRLATWLRTRVVASLPTRPQLAPIFWTAS